MQAHEPPFEGIRFALHSEQRDDILRVVHQILHRGSCTGTVYGHVDRSGMAVTPQVAATAHGEGLALFAPRMDRPVHHTR
jgi:hypothetical protein